MSLQYIRIFHISGFYLLFLLLSLPGSAQQDFRPGYIITNSNDTIHGYLDYRGDIKNSKKCIFKKDLQDPPRTYLPIDIRAYRFQEGKFYVSKKVPGKKGAPEKALFLEYLVNGIIDLYYYRDFNADHYFIEKDGRLIELMNSDKVIVKDGTQYIQESKEYIGILKATLMDCPSLFPEIDKADFSTRSFIKIAEDYHNQVCEGEKCMVYKKQIPGIRFRAGLFAGYQLSFLRFREGGTAFFSLMHFTAAQSFVPGISVNISLPRLNDKLSFSLGVSYQRSSYYADYEAPQEWLTTNYYETNLDASTLNISGLFSYMFPQGKFRPVLSLGIAMNILLHQSGEIITETEREGIVTTDTYELDPLSNLYMGPALDAGVVTNAYTKFPLYLGITYAYLYGFEPVYRGKMTAMFSRFHSLGIRAGIYF